MLLAGGKRIAVEGLEIIGPGDAPWATLSQGDYAIRSTSWPRQVIWHTTKGKSPQRVIPGTGPNGRERAVADFWRGDPEHSAAPIVIGSNGKVACLCDVLRHAAYHATLSNELSIGVEVFQEADGGIYEAALRAVRLLAPVLSRILRMPHQMHAGAYIEGRIVERMGRGGDDCVGHFGHRDQAWKFPWQLEPAARAKWPKGYANRGRGDPGDLVMAEIAASGAERFDYRINQDKLTWIPRQLFLATRLPKAGVIPDGVAGPKTMAAMAELELESGRAVDAAAMA